MYRKVYELPAGARDFLRWSLFYGGPEYDGLDAEQQSIVNACEYPEDIPDDLLDYAFSGYAFCPEDFTPMAGDDWSLV